MLVLDKWLYQIPMAALVAVMIMVSIGTFSWDSIRNLRSIPVHQHCHAGDPGDCGGGRLTQRCASGRCFAGNPVLRQQGGLHYMLLVTSNWTGKPTPRRYGLWARVFFDSSEGFLRIFDFKEAVDNVVIDLGRAHFWDITAVGALDKAVIKFRRRQDVEVIGLNEANATIVDRFGVHDEPGSR